MSERLRSGSGGAVLLVAATMAALVWANVPGGTYESVWETGLGVRAGDAELAMTLRHWVNDGLMTFFFFVIGLEVKRELVVGHLADRRRAAVPAAAALVGLVAPALVYVAFTAGTPAVGAWGVVISTDTAFVIGVLALVGSACPPQLRVFLLALAIADDVGALSVIAIFYTEDLALGPLAVAVGGLLLMVLLRRVQVWRGPAYLVVALVSWAALYLSGVHATLLGVVVALMTPAYLTRRDEVGQAGRRARAYLQAPSADSALAARLSIDRSVPVGERLQRLWEPWTTTVVVPLFALANAGVVLSGETLQAAATSPVTRGIVAGLVIGKLVGVYLGAAVAVRWRLGVLAPELTRLHLLGGAGLTGIGFTISLFIVDLALPAGDTADQARVGVLTASMVAAALGWTLLQVAAHRHPPGASAEQLVLDPPVDVRRDHVRGRPDAPMVLVEYGDFECPFCGQATGAVEDLRTQLGDRLQYAFRHLPMRQEHPHAQLAAEASEAAAAQGHFWTMHDRLFDHPDQLRSTDLLEHAAAIGLDLPRFTRDLGQGRFARRVERDATSAAASGVAGTPTFFVNGRRHTGSTDAESLRDALEVTAGDRACVVDLSTGPTASPVVTVAGHRGANAPLPPLDVAETPDEDGTFPRLSEAQLQRLVQPRLCRRVRRGEVLHAPGDVVDDFVVVLQGAVAVVEEAVAGGDLHVTVHQRGRFLGEMDVVDSQPVTRTAVVVRDGEVLQLPGPTRRQLLDADAEVRDVVLRALLLRRAHLLDAAPDARIFVSAGSDDADRLMQVVRRHGLTAAVVELDEDAAARPPHDVGHADEAHLPRVVLRSGEVFPALDDQELSDSLRSVRQRPSDDSQSE